MPRPNVVVQLCSIECSWSVPLTHPDNAAFASDLVDWAALSQRLFLWDYGKKDDGCYSQKTTLLLSQFFLLLSFWRAVVDFANYVMPWPNYETLVPNARFLAAHNVSGIFEEVVHYV